MDMYDIGCACDDKMSGAVETNLVKAEKLYKQAADMDKQASVEQSKGNWTRASALQDQAKEYRRQAAALPTLPKTKSRIQAATKAKEKKWLATLPGAGVAVGLAAALGITGYMVMKKSG